MVKMHPHVEITRSDSLTVNPLFARRAEDLSVPRFALPPTGMLPETAYQLVHDEAVLDGNARLNLATFVTTWMEPLASQLYRDTFDKNMIDKDDYPLTAAIEERCWRMLADLWHAPDPKTTIGTSTVGSSEACMLAGLALKRRWQNARRDAGKSTDSPNLVMSSAVQVVWEKFANYWDVEARYVPVSEEHPTLDGFELDKYVDEHTIGVVAILGQTYTGAYEPVAAIAAALDDLQATSGLDVPVHVDGASGAFVAPFLRPDLVWDFQLPRVHSISTSGHKYGLVYPGIGWVIWRTPDLLPDDLIFRVSYLGGEMPTLALNFSRPGAQVLLQYYNFLRLGFEGYKGVHDASYAIGQYLAAEIAKVGPFELLCDSNPATGIPTVTWRIRDGANPGYTLFHLADRLRTRGWQVPAYTLTGTASDIAVQRILVRLGVSHDMASLLLDDFRKSVAHFAKHPVTVPMSKEETGGFNHL